MDLHCTASRQRCSAKSRRSALLKAAEETFFTKGYAATTLDDVIALAGGSKRTIYTEFGGKEGLLTALVMDIADKMAAAMPREDDTPRALRSLLQEFGMGLIRVILSPQATNLYRTIVTNNNSHKHLSDIFFEAGPVRAATNLAATLEAAKTRGDLRDIDCALAASHFIGMFGNPLYLEIILGRQPVPDEQAMEHFVHSVVATFLDGVGVPSQR